MKAPAIEIGRVYYPKINRTNPRSSHRRVIDIVGGKVCYSDGGNRNKFCSVRAFRRAVSFSQE